MASPEIEEFAKILVQKVRDYAIRSCDVLLRPNAVSPTANRWKEAAAGGPESFAKMVIPDVVDDAVFELLDAIDNGHLKLSFTASDGKKVDVTVDGLSELAGWYMGSEGWREMYSKERLIDDFKHLT